MDATRSGRLGTKVDRSRGGGILGNAPVDGDILDKGRPACSEQSCAFADYAFGGDGEKTYTVPHAGDALA